MLIHVVCFQFKPDAKTKLGEAVDQILSMEGRIPGLLQLRAGVDVVHSGRSFDLGLVATLDDRAALEVYNDHPAHTPVKAFLGPLYERAVAVDFEVPNLEVPSSTR